MIISQAEFITSIHDEDPILRDKSMHIAFLGRSNVGKSSLINSLLGKKGLAKTSATPGRTKRIYFYKINDAFYFVDLPGYGYAKLPKAFKKHIGEMISWYLGYEEYGIRKCVLIIDALVGPTADDLEVLGVLRELGKDFVVVANKIDKIKSSKRKHRLDQLQKELSPIQLYPYSSKTKQGREDLWKELLMSEE